MSTQIGMFPRLGTLTHLDAALPPTERVARRVIVHALVLSDRFPSNLVALCEMLDGAVAGSVMQIRIDLGVFALKLDAPR